MDNIDLKARTKASDLEMARELIESDMEKLDKRTPRPKQVNWSPGLQKVVEALAENRKLSDKEIEDEYGMPWK